MVADQQADPVLANAAMRLAAALPARADDRISRTMLEQLGGGAPPRLRSALDHLGLHQLYHRWCGSRRCYECPLAHTVSVPPAPPIIDQ
jgi:hypothetical protein